MDFALRLQICQGKTKFSVCQIPVALHLSLARYVRWGPGGNMMTNFPADQILSCPRWPQLDSVLLLCFSWSQFYLIFSESPIEFLLQYKRPGPQPLRHLKTIIYWVYFCHKVIPANRIQKLSTWSANWTEDSHDKYCGMVGRLSPSDRCEICEPMADT